MEEEELVADKSMLSCMLKIDIHWLGYFYRLGSYSSANSRAMCQRSPVVVEKWVMSKRHKNMDECISFIIIDTEGLTSLNVISITFSSASLKSVSEDQEWWSSPQILIIALQNWFSFYDTDIIVTECHDQFCFHTWWKHVATGTEIFTTVALKVKDTRLLGPFIKIMCK